MISSQAGNWVDRGEPPDGLVLRILSYYLDLDREANAEKLAGYVRDVIGMVEADATEVNVNGFLIVLEKANGVIDRHPRHRRAVAIALWHAVKAAEVRDRAMRLLREHPEHTSTRQPLADWLIERLGRGGSGAPEA